MQRSTRSHGPLEPRQTVFALPGVNTHPVVVLQVSTVQSLPSSQTVGPPAEQVPAEQESPDVQALPSSHAVPFRFEQTPSEPGTLHARQSSGLPPLQPLLQHRPSRQMLLAHCVLRLHAAP